MKQKALIISSILLVLMLAFSTAIAGCGGEQEPEPEPTPAPAPEPEPAPAPEPEPAPAPEPEPEPVREYQPKPEPEWTPPGPVVQPDTDTIDWEEAANYIGATTTVCGKIKDVSAVFIPNLTLMMGGMLGKGVGIEVMEGVIDGDLREMYIGQTVCVTGMITDQLMGSPMIKVTDASQIVIKEPEPAPGGAVITGPVAYVTVSVDSQLLVVAQPVAVTADMTLDGALKAAHEAYFPQGEVGYAAGIDPTFGIYLISKCWGVAQTPFVLLNDTPAPGPVITTFVDATPVAENDNIIICTSNTQGEANPVTLRATLADDGTAAVTATNWIFNTMSFTYTSEPLADTNIIDPTTGTSLGTTDADGNVTVTVPESGIVAVEGLAALMVAPPEAAAPAAGGTQISWDEAVDYMNEEVTVCGPIIDTLDIGTALLLGMGTSIQASGGVGIEINPALVSDLPEGMYVGQEICVTGTPYTNPIGGASIVVSDLSQISTP